VQPQTYNINFTKRYIVAISLIAILATGAFYILHLALKESDSTALVVNISGKQRMLSQRIASLSQYYHFLSTSNQSHVLRDEIATDLKKAIQEMHVANRALSTGQLNHESSVRLSREMRDFYFGDTNLKNRIEKYLEKTSTIFEINNIKSREALVNETVMDSRMLLPDLHAAVLQYQKEGEENVAKIRLLETVAWILTLFTLMLEVIFIFQPMANTLRILFKKEEDSRNYLEQEILIRTHSLEKANEKLKYTASHDPLTGLNNRLNLEHELENLLIHYHDNGVPFAVLMLDIDWFKKVNDNYGHDVGDFVLKELSMLISVAIRNEDRAYRAGGEEFVVILNRISEEQAIAKAQKIRQAIEKHIFVFEDYAFNITISGGLYHPLWTEANDIHTVMKLADNALYAAKKAGRNCIVEAQVSVEEVETVLAPAKTCIKTHGLHAQRIDFVDFDIVDILGYSNEVLVNGGVALKDIVHPDDQDFFDRLVLRQPFMTTLRMVRSDGNIKIVKIECTPFENETWRFDIQDPIVLAQSVEDKMILQNFEAMMTNTDDFIYFKDRFHVFTAGSCTLVALTNVPTKEKLIGQTDYEVFPSEYADKYFKLEKEVFSGEIDVAREIQPFLDNYGHAGWVDNRKYPIKNKEGEIIGLFGIARIVSNVDELEGKDYV